MNESELFLKDGRTAGVWYCGQCKIVHREQSGAAQCCQPYKCDMCGSESEKYWTRCSACRDRVEAREEAKRFADAEKVTEWGGYVFHGEEFHSDASDIIDNVDDIKEVPAYVWTCDEVQFVCATVEDVLEQIEQNENCYEDFDSSTLKGIPELEAAIEAFNEANKGVIAYVPNLKRALVLSPQPE